MFYGALRVLVWAFILWDCDFVFIACCFGVVSVVWLTVCLWWFGDFSVVIMAVLGLFICTLNVCLLFGLVVIVVCLLIMIWCFD